MTKLGARRPGRDTALKPGEQLIESRWVEAADLAVRGGVALPDGMQAVSIALPVEQVVGGTIKPGDTVGVVIAATMKPTDAPEIPITRQIFHKVLVLAVHEGTTAPPARRGCRGPPTRSVWSWSPWPAPPPTSRSSSGVRIRHHLAHDRAGEADESGSRVVDGTACSNEHPPLDQSKPRIRVAAEDLLGDDLDRRWAAS